MAAPRAPTVKQALLHIMAGDCDYRGMWRHIETELTKGHTCLGIMVADDEKSIVAIINDNPGMKPTWLGITARKLAYTFDIKDTYPDTWSKKYGQTPTNLMNTIAADFPTFFNYIEKVESQEFKEVWRIVPSL